MRYVVQLFVEEVATAKGLNMSQLHRRTQVPLNTIQRYWHGKGTNGQPLDSVRLEHLNAICAVLECEPGDILRRVPVE